MKHIEYMRVSRVIGGKVVDEQEDVEVKFDHDGNILGIAVYNELFGAYFDISVKCLSEKQKEKVQDFIGDMLFQHAIEEAEWAI